MIFFKATNKNSNANIAGSLSGYEEEIYLR
jgi:hypothetical protein